LALRNVFRQRVRTALTLAAIVSGVVGLILSGGFVEDALLQLREATIHSQLGHLQVYRAGYYAHGAQAPYQYLIDQPGRIIDTVRKLPQVDHVMERLNFAGVLNNGRADIPILGEGMQPDLEAKLGGMITIIAGRQLADRDGHGILLGEGVANASRLRPGGRATLLVSTAGGALNSSDFEVVGIFRSFSRDYDARAVRIPLAAARQLLDVSGSNAVVVLLKDTAYTNEVASRLRQQLDVRSYEIKTWDQLADFYDKTVALYRRQFAVLQVMILFAVVMSVANSVNMAIFERTGEFGTLMALGNRRKSVFALVMTENMFLGLIGGGIGAVLGILLAWVISLAGIPMPPPPNSNSGYTAFIRIVPWVVASAFIVGLLATTVAAVLPARRVARLPIVDGLRQNQ
jgi:putative ABC transport system permease protein